jgi:hypothetical protein
MESWPEKEETAPSSSSVELNSCPTAQDISALFASPGFATVPAADTEPRTRVPPRQSNGPFLPPVPKHIEQTHSGCLFYYSPSSGAQIFIKKHQRLKLYRNELDLAYGPLVEDFEAHANPRTKSRREQDRLIILSLIPLPPSLFPDPRSLCPIPPSLFPDQDGGSRKVEKRDVGTSMDADLQE